MPANGRWDLIRRLKVNNMIRVHIEGRRLVGCDAVKYDKVYLSFINQIYTFSY